jgi:hypothetical protein
MAIHFHTLQMPDGSTEKINAGSMSLSYGPLRGSVSGSNRLKRVLVRSVTGVGTMASYLVGGPGGFGGLNGQLDNSVLLRERFASNAGLAGEQELSSLAFNENIVVSMPANTRFFVVLLETGGGDQKRNAAPATHAGSVQYASGNGSALPSAQELHELIELKTELNRMYQGVSSTKTSSPLGPAQQP